MDFFKIKNKLLIILCVFVVLLPFFLITFTYASEEDEENIYFTLVENKVISYVSNTIIDSEVYNLYYLELEKGYSYYITLNYPEDSRIGFSDSVETGSEVYNMFHYQNEGTFETVINGDITNYLFFDFAQNENYEPSYTIRKVKNTGYISAVSDLVDNVGINSIWNVFNDAIPYIGVVAIFVFGFVIFTFVYTRVSNGKGGL